MRRLMFWMTAATVASSPWLPFPMGGLRSPIRGGRRADLGIATSGGPCPSFTCIPVVARLRRRRDGLREVGGLLGPQFVAQSPGGQLDLGVGDRPVLRHVGL